MSSLNPRSLYNKYPKLSPEQRKEIYASKRWKAKRVLVECATEELKDAYALRYKKRMGRQYNPKRFSHLERYWRDLAKLLIVSEINIRDYTNWCWDVYAHKNTKYPTLSQIKSPLTIELFIAYSPGAGGDDHANSVYWSRSRERRKMQRRMEEFEAFAERNGI